MRSTMKLMMLWSCLTLAGTGCGSSGNDDDGQQTELTCASIAMCTTYNVKTFIADIPEPTGGVLSDGLYRLAYVLDPDVFGNEEGYSEDLSALLIQNGQFVTAGFSEYRGEIRTSGSDLFLVYQQTCQLGEAGNPGEDFEESYRYTATPDRIELYSEVIVGGGGRFESVNVYVKSAPEDICTTVSGEPSSPGDSASCNVSNCGCVFTVNDTIDPESCPT